MATWMGKTGFVLLAAPCPQPASSLQVYHGPNSAVQLVICLNTMKRSLSNRTGFFFSL
ncbi:hypothetical protein [Bacillus sp. T33-2]|uniref:hypothetical protein n=1 Tax=Bacillus sp. T33-2 TaxID=2054168 RepID=UPI0015E087D1|nr:hypothetical protein [Bacillus sp. T33-2]